MHVSFCSSIEEVPQKKNPITYNIIFGGTSSTSAAKEEAPAAEEDTLAHMANTPTLSPIRGNQFESVGVPLSKRA